MVVLVDKRYKMLLRLEKFGSKLATCLVATWKILHIQNSYPIQKQQSKSLRALQDVELLLQSV